MTLDEIRTAAIQLLREDYPFARKAIIELEVYTRSRSKKAVYQLRDCLDDFATIFREDVDVEEARHHLAEATAHLRRCVVEPIEYLAENEIVKVDKYSDKWLLKVPFPGNPLKKSAFFEQLAEARQAIADGRMNKTSIKAYDDFKRALVIAKDLLSEIHPTQWTIRAMGWIFVFVMALGAAITAYTQLFPQCSATNVAAEQTVGQRGPDN